jgi:hypothetical protein
LSRRKTVVATQIEILNFVKHFGLERCAFLTLEFRKNMNLKKAQAAFNNAARRFLKELFPGWICVVEFNGYDQPHFHLLVATREDYRSDFSFSNYNQMTAITKRASRERRSLTVAEKRERGSFARSLTTDPKLKALWKHLREKLPDFKFSKRRPAELVPIQKNAEAIAVYVTSQFLYEELLSYIPRGARLVRFSKTCPRVIPRISNLVIDTPGRDRYLMRRDRILNLLAIPDVASLRKHFGRQGYYRCHLVNQVLVDRFGQYAIPWESPKVLAIAQEIWIHGYTEPEDDLGDIIPRRKSLSS